MEFNLKRRKRDTDLLFLSKNFHSSYLDTYQNETMASSPDNSYIIAEPQIQTTIIDHQVRKKASMLLSLPISPRVSVRNNINKISNREVKLSLMHSPRKKITIAINQTEYPQKNKSLARSKMGNFFLSRTGSDNFYGQRQCENNKIETQQEKQKNIQKSEYSLINKRNPINYFSISQYFSLVFSKILSKSGKQKIYVFIEQLSLRYQKYPQIIQQDVIDMKTIASKLMLALCPKQNYVQLKPFQALEVNGQLARLIFHLVHQITTRKYKNYDLIKIYKEIQFCSRRLELNKFTLKVCFRLGQIYKQNNDQLNSHAYFTKALKLAIFLNDKFHEQKAIDCFGVTAYSAHKTGQAHYFHQNFSKLNVKQREIIKQKYSKIDQIDKINQQRELLRSKGQQTSRNWTIFQKKKQKFNFNGLQYSGDYEIQNKRRFKQKIKEYIQCPVMRSNILVARCRINKIDNIGRITRYKDWQASRIPIRFKGGQDAQSSSEVLLTHRSLNRINPEYENRILQKEKKVLIELINYYMNDSILPSS